MLLLLRPLLRRLRRLECSFFSKNWENVPAAPVNLRYFKSKQLVNAVVVSPDAGGVKRAKTFMEGMNAVGVPAELAMIIKQREEAAGESNQAVGQVSTQSAHGPIART